MEHFTINKNRLFQIKILFNYFSYSQWLKNNPSSCENYKEKRESVCFCFCYNAWKPLPPIFRVKGLTTIPVMIQFHIIFVPN